MKSVVRPELSTASAGSSQAPTAAVDNSAPISTTRNLLINRGKLFKQPRPLLVDRIADSVTGLQRLRKIEDCRKSSGMSHNS
jgi:hypothetical protein